MPPNSSRQKDTYKIKIVAHNSNKTLKYVLLVIAPILNTIYTYCVGNTQASPHAEIKKNNRLDYGPHFGWNCDELSWSCIEADL